MAKKKYRVTGGRGQMFVCVSVSLNVNVKTVKKERKKEGECIKLNLLHLAKGAKCDTPKTSKHTGNYHLWGHS